MIRHLAFLLLLTVVPDTALALPPIGRLFLTPAERQAIDRLRQPPAPAPQPFVDHVSGPCGRTTWRNGQRQYDARDCTATGRHSPRSQSP